MPVEISNFSETVQLPTDGKLSRQTPGRSPTCQVLNGCSLGCEGSHNELVDDCVRFDIHLESDHLSGDLFGDKPSESPGWNFPGNRNNLAPDELYLCLLGDFIGLLAVQ